MSTIPLNSGGQAFLNALFFLLCDYFVNRIETIMEFLSKYGQRETAYDTENSPIFEEGGIINSIIINISIMYNLQQIVGNLMHVSKKA